MISVIIPVKNEGSTLFALLDQLQAVDGVEVIVVDGGSEPEQLAPILQRSEITLIKSTSPRSKQMIQGAKAAKGEIIFFLHADSVLSEGWKTEIETLLIDPKVVAGAFKFQVDVAGFAYKILEFGVVARCLVGGIPYGDQGLFLTKKIYEVSGGFQELPLMEDYEFVTRLKKMGDVAISSLPLITSARRFQKLGVLKSVWINYQVVKGYKKGLDPEILRKYYQEEKG